MGGLRFGLSALAVTVSVLVGSVSAGATPAPRPLSPSPSPSEVAASPGDPAYSIDLATLDAALDCDPFTHPDREPVLLVHGTFTMGHEQYDWNYALRLRETGHDVCVVTYPDRGLGDMQISAEYVARAVQRIAAESGSKVDMVGHSQGALMPRWAIKYWPSVRDALDDFVLLAGPSHGTSVAGGSGGGLPTGQPPVLYQFSSDSAFMTALNDGDETPGDIDYTSIYTRFDELVQPVDPIPTAALDRGLDNPRVANVLLQDLCPLRIVDHLTIGTTDRLALDLTIDALDHDGPAQPDRLALDPLACSLPDQYLAPATFTALLAQLPTSAAAGLPDIRLVDAEPALRAYALTVGAEPVGGVVTDVVAPTPAAPITPPAQAADRSGSVASAASPPQGSLPSTGRAIPILAAGVAIGVALLLRAGRSRLDDRDDGDDEPDR